MRLQLFLLVALAALVGAFTACATPDTRIEERQAIFDNYPSDVQAKIRAGRVAADFTEDMVWMALGDPDEKLVESSERGETAIWIYTRSRPGVGISLGGGSYGGGGFGGGSVGTGTSAETDYEAEVHFEDGFVTFVRQEE